MLMLSRSSLPLLLALGLSSLGSLAEAFTLGGAALPSQAWGLNLRRSFGSERARIGALSAPSTLGRRCQLRGLAMQVFGQEEEAPKGQKELMQIRLEKVDAPQLKDFIQKWPFGGKKDGYGLPKLMLPVEKDKNPRGVKLTFKGSLDPWLQVELEGDTVRVYRESMMSSTFMQVSALKEREEKKICDKLKEDLQGSAVAAGASVSEREIPVVEPVKEEEEPEEEAKAEEPESEEPVAKEEKPPA